MNIGHTTLLAFSIAAALSGCGSDGDDGANGTTGDNGVDGSDLTSVAKLIRIATVPIGAEITGLFKTDNGDLFFNVQHPSDTLTAPDNNAAVGVIEGFDLDNLNTRLTDVVVPATDSAEAKTVTVASGSYRALGRAGDTFQGALPYGLGGITDGAMTQSLHQSQDPDFNAFLASNADGSEGFLFTSWEDRPGAVSRMSVAKMDDTWSVSDVINIDFSSVAGTLINCFGTLSPWGTPLVSEENYEAENTEDWNNSAYTSGYPSYTDVVRLKDYLAGVFPNPYRYGYIVEITNPKNAAPVPVKHFTLGRMAHENSVVMPDQKTVYLTDDGSDKGFYKFIATTAGDLSAGTIYAAKVTQDATSDTARAGLNITWIELGSSTNAQLATWIADYDGIDETDFVDGSTSYITEAEIQDWADNGTGDDRYAFLETLHAARAKGATTEFRKMEGININFHGVAANTIPYMYVAMSEVAQGMADAVGDIQLTQNKCGVVYRMGLDANFNVSRMEPAVVGGAYDSTAAANRCATDAISNPDNIVVMDDGRVVIGEDTSNHENNMIWVYNPAGQ